MPYFNFNPRSTEGDYNDISVFSSALVYLVFKSEIYLESLALTFFLTYILKFLVPSNFKSLEVVDRGRGTQLYIGKNITLYL